MAVGRTNEGEKRRSEGAARKFINLGGRGTLTTEASNTGETRAIPHKGLRSTTRTRKNRGGGGGRGEGTVEMVDGRPKRKELGHRLEVGSGTAKGGEIGILLRSGVGGVEAAVLACSSTKLLPVMSSTR